MYDAILDDLDPLEADVAPELDARGRLLALASHVGDLTPALGLNLLVEIGGRVVEDYETDKQDRKDWEETVKDALKSAGQEGDQPVRVGPWTKSADVKYPLITVGALQFQARAYPAVVKGEEAVSIKIIGKDDGVPAPQAQPQPGQPPMGAPEGQPQPQQWAIPPGAKAARAKRVREYMNTTIFHRMEDWESDTDAMLLQLPIVGCAFRKVWYDAGTRRQCAALVPALRLIAPIGAKSCKTTPRLTEEIPDVYPIDILQKMRADQYREVDLWQVDDLDRKPRLLLEQHRLIDLDEDGLPEPYIVTVDHETRAVLRIESNFSPEGVKWNGERAASIERGQYYIKYDFFPHPEGKFYGVGLGHLLKHIGAVVNTAINQMIDAGTAQVAGGGFVGSGVRLTGNRRSATLRFEPGEYKVVDLPGDKLREGIVERTFPAPSPLMFQILEFMLGAATDISSVKDVVTGDASNNGQVGTTLALIEQGLAQFTAIYKRIYRSLKDEYDLLFENIGKHGGDEAAADYREVLDDPAADFEADFKASDMDIRPVSDPASVTKMQQLARAQFLQQFVGAPGMNPQAIMKRVFAAADIEDPDELFAPPAPPNPQVVAETETEMAKAAKMKAETEGLKVKNLTEAHNAGVLIGSDPPAADGAGPAEPMAA